MNSVNSVKRRGEPASQLCGFALQLDRLFVYHSRMQKGQDTIPIGKNRFPGVVAFVETFDTDNDVAEPEDILSFESLREAFVTLRSDEDELPEETEPDVPERPDYDIDVASGSTMVDSEDADRLFSTDTENSAVVNTRLETIIEAVLFVGNRENRPIGADQIIEKLRNVSEEEVVQTVAHLNRQYQERNSPYIILPECGGYRMVLRPEFEPVRANFYGKVRETRLSQQVIDILAIVAYRQPITAEEVQNIRRRPCAATLNQLVRRNLLKISREVQDKKSVVRYQTTSRFLELFQIKSLDDIPRVDELDYR